jgi:hypothetical protein
MAPKSTLASGTYLKTVVIASGAQDSAEVDLDGLKLVAITTPGTMTGTSLSFKVATASGGTFNGLYKDDGNLYSATVAASRCTALDNTKFYGARYIKVRSGSAEGADRTLTLHLLAV